MSIADVIDDWAGRAVCERYDGGLTVSVGDVTVIGHGNELLVTSGDGSSVRHMKMVDFLWACFGAPAWRWRG